MTKEKFIPNPFSDDPDARLFKAGDLGSWNVDGTINFLGRNDHQVKVRGFRIELGEIESQLRSHDLIEDAVVAACEVEGIEDDKRLVAYVIQKTRVELWPSIAEFYVYDDLAYMAMSSHELSLIHI